MSIKSKVLAAAATLTLVGGTAAAGALTAGPASAATPSCGPSCVDVFSAEFGTHHSPNFVLDVLRQGDKVDQPIILFRAANYDPAEDFTISFEGYVSDFYTAGLVSAAVDLHYGAGACYHYNQAAHSCTTYFPNDKAYEIQYSPYGVNSGLCVGTAVTAYDGARVNLQPCGVSSKTVWIKDRGGETFNGGYVPLINGSDTNFSQPFVLTYPTNGYPTDMPRPQLLTTNLTGFSQPFGVPNGTINENQLWGRDWGVLG